MSTLACGKRSGRLVLVAPHAAVVPFCFGNVIVDPERAASLLAQVQLFRAAQYRADGAIPPEQLSADGRHVQSGDSLGWHVIALASSGEVQAAVRCIIRQAPVPFDELGIAHAAIASCAHWGSAVRTAMNHLIASAASRGERFAEIGGWAVAPHRRRTPLALRMAFTVWALSRRLGGQSGIATATRRHQSAAILRKLGCRSLRAGEHEIPKYFDPAYGCEMELLHFDGVHSSARINEMSQEISDDLLGLPVYRTFSRQLQGLHREPACHGGVLGCLNESFVASVLP